MSPLRTFAVVAIALTVLAIPARLAAQQPDDVVAALEQLERLLPTDDAGFRGFDSAPLDQAARQIEAACADLSESQIAPGRSPVAACQVLLEAKRRTDAALDALLALRGDFAAWPADSARDAALRAYLRAVSRLIDLSGRLRYVQYDAFDAAAAVALEDAAWQRDLVRAAVESRSLAAATAWGVALAPVAPGVDVPATLSANAVLDLYSALNDASLLASLANYARQRRLTPPQRLRAVAAIHELGLPQDPRPQDGKEAYQPAILAEELKRLTESIDAAQLKSEERQRREQIIAALDERMAHGVTEPSYRHGNVAVQPGDWLLMRNPSPYNHFTSLSPGLFTHVGVITDEIGPDGKRRIVVVDLPERGDRMPATNFDTFILRTLHYVVLRHPDPVVAARMADVARTLIDCPTEFDLNFDTSRVNELRGKITAGVKVKTYCAGLLLLCAQETSLPREAFFPIAETVAPGHTERNLATLGLSVKDDFISPTGPLFSPSLMLVARREPMYEPGREIREALYDHFAESLATKTLTSAPNVQQALRIRLAEMARDNQLLAAALAQANQVSADLDLVAAAKAAAVVESLDEVADASAGSFVDARDAIRAGSNRELRAARVPREKIQEIDALRRRHPQLSRAWEQAELSPRELREALVRYYIERGAQQIDERFFSRRTPSESAN
ncbi:MAG: hypothetical protein SGJ19_26975 [Planctomycetia bacterium]|nr:hypothetical protein [Planctomycetia bacterium]